MRYQGRLQVQRMSAVLGLSSPGGGATSLASARAHALVPGDQSYLVNAMMQLHLAALIMLHVIPKATREALKPCRSWSHPVKSRRYSWQL